VASVGDTRPAAPNGAWPASDDHPERRRHDGVKRHRGEPPGPPTDPTAKPHQQTVFSRMARHRARDRLSV